MDTRTPAATLYVVIVTGPYGPDTEGVYETEPDARRAAGESTRANPAGRPIVLPAPYYPATRH